MSYIDIGFILYVIFSLIIILKLHYKCKSTQQTLEKQYLWREKTYRHVLQVLKNEE